MSASHGKWSLYRLTWFFNNKKCNHINIYQTLPVKSHPRKTRPRIPSVGYVWPARRALWVTETAPHQTILKNKNNLHASSNIQNYHGNTKLQINTKFWILAIKGNAEQSRRTPSETLSLQSDKTSSPRENEDGLYKQAVQVSGLISCEFKSRFRMRDQKENPPLKASKRKRVRPYPSPVAEENAVRVRGPSLVSGLHVGRSVDTHVHHPSHWKHHTRQVVRVRMGTAQNALPSRTICRSSAHSDNWQILALQFLPWLSSHPSRLIPC